MSSVVISGDTSGTITVSAPLVAGTNTLTLQAGTATNSMNTLATAVASTSGTSIDFTGLPSWVKRITVMFNGVSTSGTSAILIQLGDSGGVEITGYVSTGTSAGNTVATTNSTAGFIVYAVVASHTNSGHYVFTLVSGNTWIGSGVFKNATGTTCFGAGDKTTSSTLDRVRITTVNGTDTFDGGTVNILYEG
jgi:hypothetical protein